MQLLTQTSLAFLCFVFAVSAQTNAPNVPTRPLSLEEAIRLALENNFEIARFRYEPQISQLRLNAASVYYEPVLSGSASHFKTTREGQRDPTLGITLPSSETEGDTFSSDVNGFFGPTGLRYDIGADFGHSFGSDRSGRFDSYTSDVGIGLTQPLLRDFWIDANRLSIKVARSTLKISEHQLMFHIIDVIRQVQQNYYELVAARDQVVARDISLTLAQRLVEENRQRVKAGVLAPLDEKQAESESALREADLIQARAVVTKAENVLKGLISNNYEQWHAVTITPTEKLIAVSQIYDVQESWLNGLNLRPDYNEVKERLVRQGYEVKYSFNQIFPRMDLIGTYGRRGFDSRTPIITQVGTNPPAITGFRGGSFSGTLDDIREDRNPYYSFGLRVEIPLTFRQERSRHKAEQALEEQMKIDLQQKHQEILIDIDDAIKAANAAYERVQATRAGTEFAQQALDAEQKKLDNGKSTSFVVLRLQRDLTDARAQEIRALADYNKALAQLFFEEGTILQKNRVKVEITK